MSAGTSKKDSSQRIADLFGYTAENNPYGDTNLHETFVWRKKIQREIETGVRTAAPTKAEHRRERDELMGEIERARDRRVQREKEREETERLRAEEARLKDAQQYHDWEAKEEEFHTAQVRQRSIIRMREARERPVDILAKNILLIEMAERGEDADDANKLVAMDVELNEPGAVLSSLPPEELEALLGDIDRFLVLEGDDGRYRRFWVALRIAAVDLLERARSRSAADAASSQSGGSVPATGSSGTSAAAAEAVDKEIDAMFSGKSEDDLTTMEDAVRETIRRGVGGGAAVDVDYWERVLRHLKAAQAHQALRRMHEELLLTRLGQLERKRRELSESVDCGLEESGVSALSNDMGSSAAAPGQPHGSLSPTYEPDLLPDTAAAGVEGALDAAHDDSDLVQRRLNALRRQGVLPPQSGPSLHERLHPVAAGGGEGDGFDESTAAFIDASGRPLPLGLSEADFGGAGAEVPIPALAAAALLAAGDAATAPAGLSAPEALMWQEKWRPRKPRYFNRVKTGYDWNKYNQAHYDHDNPPPKAVQGYKFNIFYPDLLDRAVAPRFFLEPADSNEFCIIRFHAGPPYEDIAFKIVNREWELQKKHGYRASFDRGTLQLHFNFKRYRYRK